MAKRKGRAPRGTGSVGFDKAAGRWYARVYVPGTTGRRRAHKVMAASEAAAEDERRRLVRQYGLDGEDAPPATLGDYLDDWLDTHGRSVRASTRRSYADHIRLHITPLLGGIPLHRLRPRDVDRLIADRLRAGLSPSSVVRITTTLRTALNHAVARRMLTDNPASMAVLPRIEPRIVPAMTEAQAERITEVTAGTWLGPIVVLILGSGLRLGEAVGLDWGDVHEDEGYVMIHRTKTVPRPVPISDDAADALRALRVKRTLVSPTAPVFLRERAGRGERADDQRMRAQSVTHALPELLEANKLPRVTPHGLRHGAATLMVGRGVHMRVIAEQLGHRDGGALAGRVYAHVVPEHQRAAARSLNRVRGA